MDPSGHKKKKNNKKVVYNSGSYLPKQAWDSLRESKAKESTYYEPKKAKKFIYEFLKKSIKANDEEACAILGNIYVETWHTYSSRILQGGSKPNASYIKAYKINDQKGWGILQWTYFSRKEALKKYVTKANKE